jgi:hypothetical protein
MRQLILEFKIEELSKTEFFELNGNNIALGDIFGAFNLKVFAYPTMNAYFSSNVISTRCCALSIINL